jgi:hypothetical protein
MIFLSPLTKHAAPEGALGWLGGRALRQEQGLGLLLEALCHLPPCVTLLADILQGLRLRLDHLLPGGEPFPQEVYFQLDLGISKVFLSCFTWCLNVYRPEGLGIKGAKFVPEDPRQFRPIDFPFPLVRGQVGDITMTHHLIEAFTV